MAKKGIAPQVTLACSKCPSKNYHTIKSKGKSKGGTAQPKLELSKFCRRCREHTMHKESK
jgi:large subunit ribosomal protein L33